MSNSDKTPKDTETILMALDQISQTIDVMTSVVGRLRTYVREHNFDTTPSEARSMQADTRSDRVLH